MSGDNHANIEKRANTPRRTEDAGRSTDLRAEAYDKFISNTSDTVRDLAVEVAKASVQERILESSEADADYGSLVRTASVPGLTHDPIYADIPRPSNMAIPGGFRRDFVSNGNGAVDDSRSTDITVNGSASKEPSLLRALLREHSTLLYSWVEGIDYEEDDDLETPTRLVFRRSLSSQERSTADEHLVGDTRTKITFFKCYVATGILFLPSGFKSAGLAAALATVVVVGMTSVYSVCLLLRTKAFVESNAVDSARSSLLRSKSNVATLSELGERSMGKPGKYLVEFSTFFSQVGFCCVYFSFAGRTVNSAFGLSIPLRDFVLGAALFITPLTYIRHLAYFSIPNLIGTLFVVVSLLLITGEALLVILTNPGRDINWSCRGDSSSACLGINTETFLAFFGTCVYIFEGTTMVLPIQQSMKHPEHLSSISVTILSSIALMFCVFGGLNFYAYGQDTGIIILRNQPSTLRLVLSTMFIVVAIFMFPLMIFPAANVLEKHIFEKQRRSGRKWAKNGLRTLLVASCATVAVLSGDSLDSLVAVIGGLFCVPLALVYPALFFLESGCAKSFHGDVIPAALTLAFGVLSSVLSSGSAIRNLIVHRG